MKALALTLVTGLVLAGAVASAAAAAGTAHSRKHKRIVSAHQHHTFVRRERQADNEAYYVHDANKLPFGSQRWWEQMVREGRIGSDAN
jgi:hypothetical protein